MNERPQPILELAGRFRGEGEQVHPEEEGLYQWYSAVAPTFPDMPIVV